MKKKLSIVLLSLAMAFNTCSLVGYADGVSVDSIGNQHILKQGSGKGSELLEAQSIADYTNTFSESSNKNISVTLNGETLTFDVQPQLIDNRTMVPLRKIFEAMGAVVDWNNDTQTVTATKGNERVIATINSKNVYINGETKTLDVPPMVIDDRTLVPVRFVAEAFGANVDWDEATRTVIIGTKWNGVGEVPCYSKYPTIPDLGAILGITGYEYNSDSSGAVYRYNLKDVSSLMPYVSAMEKLGFNVESGIIDSIMYTGTKNEIIIDVVLWDNNIDITITLPENESAIETQDFTKGYELAEFSKFNSPASENGLGDTPIYINCVIDNTEVMTVGEQQMILGYLTDSSGHKWMCMLNTTVFDSESNFKNIVGKDVVLCGIYSGYSSVKQMPVIELNKLYVKNTGEIKTGIDAIIN
jgi:hypothetical protein